jgi:cytochrome c-type biogenesis protein CcmH
MRPSRVLPWLALVVVLIIALVAGAGNGGPVDAGERTERLQRQIACPECDGQSVAESNAAVADTIRRYIADQVEQGATDEEIRDRLVASYGRRVLLSPERGGLVGLVWILPVVGLLVGIGGLAWAFRSWRSEGIVEPSDLDRRLVDEARGRDIAEPGRGGEST